MLPPKSSEFRSKCESTEAPYPHQRQALHSICFRALTKIPNDERVFTDVLGDLEAIEHKIWQQLTAAVGDAQHGWHLPVLGTASNVGCHLRTVVLRDVLTELRHVICHTDRRSEKMAHITADPRVQWHFYDAVQRVQVVLTGTATVHTSNAFADQRWNASRLESRRCYLAPHAPGEVVSSGNVNLPAELRNTIPTEEQSAAGRENFAVVDATITEIDWLYLHQHGNVRAKFVYQDGRVDRDWIAA